MQRALRHGLGALAMGTLIAIGGQASAQQKEIKLGVIFDLTGPFAAGGSEAAAVGTMNAIEYINDQGGIEGWKVNAILADAQSKAEVAIAEAPAVRDHPDVQTRVAGIADDRRQVAVQRRLAAGHDHAEVAPGHQIVDEGLHRLQRVLPRRGRVGAEAAEVVAVPDDLDVADVRQRSAV